jgi:hypothetical protein
MEGDDMKTIKNTICFIMLFLLLFSLCACSKSFGFVGGAGSTPYSTSPTPTPTPAPTPDMYAEEYMGVLHKETAQSIEGISTPGAGDERKIITTIYLRMESKEYDKSANAIFDAVKIAGGYIEFSDIAGNIKMLGPENTNVINSLGLMKLAVHTSFEVRSDSYRDGDRRFMQLRIRIPQTNLSGFLTQIEACGNVLSKQENSEDITLQYVDTESHIIALTAERERLLTMLEKAENVEEMIVLEQRLSEIRYQLERYESTLRVYKNQISYATVNLTLNEVLIYTESAELPVTVGERISVGWNQTISDIQNYWKYWFVWFVVNSIYIIAILFGIVIAIIILRKFTRRFLAAAKVSTASEEVTKSDGAEQAPEESKKKE